jgi:hypothetical protein
MLKTLISLPCGLICLTTARPGPGPRVGGGFRPDFDPAEPRRRAHALWNEVIPAIMVENCVVIKYFAS